MPKIVKGLLGKGLRFPFTVNSKGGVLYNEWIDRINQSLFILFETPKGSRLMQPEWGSDIEKYRFDPFDDVLLEKLEATITEDIRLWEPRIILDSIEFKADSDAKDSHILYILLSYHLVNTDIQGNYVYPYRSGTTPTLINDYL